MLRNRTGVLVVVAGLACGCVAQEVSPNWFRSPAVSPDGGTIVFRHGGDLYRVAAEGGVATPLTIHEAFEARPVWSPDGSMIAFASDRFGNEDVFVMPAEGGEVRRLTYHSAGDLPSGFTADGSAVLFQSSRTDDVKNSQFPSGVLSELYSVPVDGGTPTQVLTTPALRARQNADGLRLLYEDRKGYENELRKHHVSSIARDVWLYDAETGSHTKLTSFAGEDREPWWGSDGQSVVFLSERSGDSNVWRMPVAPGAQAEQLTDFEHHPVRGLSVSDGGDVVFSWHGEIYRMPAGGEASVVPIRIGGEARDGGRHVETARSGATEFAVAPSGKEIAFVVRGEVFVTSVDFGTTRRITSTPGQERSVSFSPDGRSVLYAGERDGSWNIYETTLADEGELYFFSATAFEERAVVATEAEEFQPAYSPDGERVGYLHNRTEVRAADRETGESVEILSGDRFYSYSDGDHWFRWSPDGSYIATEFLPRDRWLSQVGLLPSDGSEGEPVELTKSGYQGWAPRWAMDGGLVIWESARYGERAHGSWGGETDIMGAFLTQDAYDRFRMSKEEYELHKELEEKREEAEKEAAGDDADTEEGDEAEETEEVEPVEIEMEGLENRVVRLTLHSAALGDFVMSPEGDRLYYAAEFEDGYDLWVRDFRENETKLLKKMGANGGSFVLSEDGDSLFVLADGSLSKVDAESGSSESIRYSAELDLDMAAERAGMLEHVWRQTLQKFYREDMHGVDWAFYREQYEPKLAGITNNEEFAELLSELLGELNASHTGGSHRPGGEAGDSSTASLGVFYDNGYAGPGMRIAEVMEGGPLDRADVDIEAGMVITHVDGRSVADAPSYYALLDGKSGERVRLTVEGGDGEAFDEVVRPVSMGAESQLRYERWVRQRREVVEEASGGRLGYVHVRGMNDASFRVLWEEVLGRHAEAEALVVDTRFNGGGWLHDDLVTFLSGQWYVDMYPRNIEAPGKSYFGESSKRWTRPSVVVMSESNYSDAHFFPWAYAELGIGPTVGMPVPGTATAVWWERLHTGDIVFGIPQIGLKGKDGVYLENDQLEPDYMVPLRPEDAAAGEDPQLQEAVRVMLEQLDGG